MSRLISPAWRARVLARPGITARPVCATCGQARDPEDFVRAGHCAPCARRQRLEARLLALDTMLGGLWPAEREWPDNQALAEEIRRLEGERFAVYFELHPDECSHMGEDV